MRICLRLPGKPGVTTAQGRRAATIKSVTTVGNLKDDDVAKQ